MATPRKATVPTTDAIDAFCAQFDDLFARATTTRTAGAPGTRRPLTTP
jgi:hypothetical protein